MATLHTLPVSLDSYEQPRPIIKNVTYQKHMEWSKVCNLSSNVCDDKTQPCETEQLFMKAIRLLSDPHTRLRDLNSLCEVFNLCADKLETSLQVYKPIMLQMIRLCKIPFLKERSSDEENYTEICADFLSQLVACTIQLISVGAAKGIALRLCTPSSTMELMNTSVEILLNMMEHELPEVMVEQWIKQIGNEECLIQFREAISILLAQSYSEQSRSVRNSLFTLINVLVRQAIRIGWLEKLNLAGLGILRQLVQVLTLEIIKTRNPVFKNLKLLPNRENFDLKKLALCILVNLTQDAACVRIMSEMRLMEALIVWAHPFDDCNFDTDSHQQELEEPVTCGHVTEEDEKSMQISPEKEQKVNKDVSNSSGSVQKWSVAYLEELQLQVLDGLAQIGAVLMRDFIKQKGPAKIIRLFEWCQTSDSFAGLGNSYHGNGGYQSKRAQLRFTLRLIRSLCGTDEPVLLECFVNESLIASLVPVISTAALRKPQPRPHDELTAIVAPPSRGRRDGLSQSDRSIIDDEPIQLQEDQVGLEMQTDALFILAKLCEDNLKRKEILGPAGIDTLLGLLELLPDRLALLSNEANANTCVRAETFSPAIDRVSQVTPILDVSAALIDSVWSCIIGCTSNEDYFLQRGGATMLLNLLEWYPRSVCSQLLGCLVDLTENPQCLSHLIHWSGCRPLERSTGLSGLDAIAKVLTDTPAIGASNKLTKLTKLSTNNEESSERPNDLQIEKARSSVVERSTNRLIAFARGPSLVELLCYLWRWEESERLGLPSGPQAHLWNESRKDSVAESTESQPSRCGSDPTFKCDSLRLNVYALFLRLGFDGHENLISGDRIILKKIERYFDLKTSEIWNNIQSDLDLTGVRPITPDAEALLHITRWGEQQAQNICHTQQKLCEAEEASALQAEQECYGRIREIQRYREKARLDFQDFIARTSNVAYLKVVSKRQSQAIEASRITRPMDPDSCLHNRPSSPTPPTTETDEDNVLTGTNTASSRPLQRSSMDSTDFGRTCDVTHHETLIPGLNVTAFCARGIQVESTPRHLFYQTTRLEREMLKVIV